MPTITPSPGPCCEWCQTPYLPRQATQRFCCVSCKEKFFNRERREAIDAFRQQKEANV